MASAVRGQAVSPAAGGSRAKRVSAIVINYECGELLLTCLEALEGQISLLETIIVDNGSTDGSTQSAVARFPHVKVVEPGINLGFAGGANLGARAATGDILFFLNPDVVVSEVTEYGCTLDPIGSPVGLTETALPLYISGCALMTRSSLFHELGGFDDRFFMFMEDADYCWRVLLRGYDVRLGRAGPVLHQGGAVAEGGYVTSTGVMSTPFRIVLRERNTLAMLLKCYSVPMLLLTLPVYVLQSVVTAAACAAVGARSTAWGILRGLVWNARELDTTLALRRRAQRPRRLAERVILRRMYRGVWKLTVLSRFGMPTVRRGS
jgi:N-acetylglucosaminyl-diphospho-decaprenol L-rhamnosyltransferase